MQFQLRDSAQAWVAMQAPLRSDPQTGNSASGDLMLAKSHRVTELTAGAGRTRLLFPAQDVRLDIMMPCPAPVDLPDDLPDIGGLEFLSTGTGAEGEGLAIAWRCLRPRLPFRALEGVVCFNAALVRLEAA